MDSSGLRDLVDRLRATSEGFIDGRREQDFLAFDDGDEMNGYAATPLEASFVELSKGIRGVLDEGRRHLPVVRLRPAA